MNKSILIKIFLVFLGSVSLSLGIIGIFIPLLPTTPFLLLTAACYIKSSDKLYQWLMKHPYLGPYIRNYREKQGLTRNSKIFVLLFLWLTISSSIYIAQNLHTSIFLLLIATGVTVHILRLKTL